MTTDDKPAPEPPPPWRWEGVSDFIARDNGARCYTALELVDANGDPVVTVNSADTLDVASARVRAVIAAAPEMAALLREMYDSQAIVMDGETNQVRDLRRDGMRRGFEKIGPLLARIDAAGKPTP